MNAHAASRASFPGTGATVAALLTAALLAHGGTSRAQSATQAYVEHVPIAQFGIDAQHTGRSPFRAPHTVPAIEWRVRARHRVFASPLARERGGCIFAGVDGGVHALDVNGVERWARLFDHEIFATPSLWGHLVLAGRVGGAVTAIDPRGNAAWEFAASEDVDAPIVVQGANAYVASHGVTALSRDGHVRWTATTPGHIVGAPGVTCDGNTVYAADVLGNLVAIRAESGEIVHRTAIGQRVYGGILVLDDGGVVLGTRDGHVRAFGPDGNARWDFATRDEIHGTPALSRDGVVVIGSDDGGVYGIRAQDGTQVFRTATSGRVRASAIFDNEGFVFIGSEDDTLYALEPNGTLAWRLSIGADIDDSVAIGGDSTVYVGSDDAGLYALSGR
jgi:outer membrane protein assembly factor BamB